MKYYLCTIVGLVAFSASYFGGALAGEGGHIVPALILTVIGGGSAGFLGAYAASRT